jgi:hypothetical protein
MEEKYAICSLFLFISHWHIWRLAWMWTHLAYHKPNSLKRWLGLFQRRGVVFRTWGRYELVIGKEHVDEETSLASRFGWQWVVWRNMRLRPDQRRYSWIMNTCSSIYLSLFISISISGERPFYTPLPQVLAELLTAGPIFEGISRPGMLLSFFSCLSDLCKQWNFSLIRWKRGCRAGKQAVQSPRWPSRSTHMPTRYSLYVLKENSVNKCI